MMEHTKIDELLLRIRTNIHHIEYTYGTSPTSIIIGSDILVAMMRHFRSTITYGDSRLSREECNRLFGIPIVEDYVRRNHVEVCVGYSFTVE